MKDYKLKPYAYLLTYSVLCLRVSVQEGFGNAAIILDGIFGPLQLYSTKKFEALLNQNPQAPETIAYYKCRKEIQDRSFFLIPLYDPFCVSICTFVLAKQVNRLSAHCLCLSVSGCVSLSLPLCVSV